jgi:hypothetical protein
MTIEKKSKRRPGYPITINKNVEQVSQKVKSVCDEHGVSASTLFSVIIDSISDEQWKEFAKQAKSFKIATSKKVKRMRAELAEIDGEA